MKNGYWIPIAAALGLSYTAGEWDIYEAHAEEGTRTKLFSAELSPGSITNAASIVNTDLCPVIIAELGLAPAACTAQKVIDHAAELCFKNNDDGDPIITSTMNLPATIIISMPE